MPTEEPASDPEIRDLLQQAQTMACLLQGGPHGQKEAPIGTESRIENRRRAIVR